MQLCSRPVFDPPLEQHAAIAAAGFTLLANIFVFVLRRTFKWANHSDASLRAFYGHYKRLRKEVRLGHARAARAHHAPNANKLPTTVELTLAGVDVATESAAGTRAGACSPKSPNSAASATSSSPQSFSWRLFASSPKPTFFSYASSDASHHLGSTPRTTSEQRASLDRPRLLTAELGGAAAGGADKGAGAGSLGGAAGKADRGSPWLLSSWRFAELVQPWSPRRKFEQLLLPTPSADGCPSSSTLRRRVLCARALGERKDALAVTLTAAHVGVGPDGHALGFYLRMHEGAATDGTGCDGREGALGSDAFVPAQTLVRCPSLLPLRHSTVLHASVARARLPPDVQTAEEVARRVVRHAEMPGLLCPSFSVVKQCLAWALNLSLLIGSVLLLTLVLLSRKLLPRNLQATAATDAEWRASYHATLALAVLNNLVLVDSLKAFCLAATAPGGPLESWVLLRCKLLRKPLRRLYWLLDAQSQ
jgi:hypothetical protein